MIRNLKTFLHGYKPKYDDDVVDRCNYLLTNIILLICAITVAAKQYVGEPLQCWIPAEFKGGWEQYIENYCFVESTYFVSIADDIPNDDNNRYQHRIQYYQWIPFILTLQALLFLVPHTIWKMFSWQTGLNIGAIIDVMISTKKAGKKRFLKKEIFDSDHFFTQARQITSVVDFNRKKFRNKNSKTSLLWQMYVTTLYLFCKSLNLLIIAMQFYLLNCLLDMPYNLWGFEILSDLIQGKEWPISSIFPRVTLCDVTIREIGNTNRKTVQCVLMINMFNEKIFIALWFWLMFLGILTTINLVYWIIIIIIPKYSKSFITSYLTFQNIQPTEKELDQFLHHCIGKDAITMLRLVSENAGGLIASELLAALWNINQEHIKMNCSKDNDDVVDN